MNKTKKLRRKLHSPLILMVVLIYAALAPLITGLNPTIPAFIILILIFYWSMLNKVKQDMFISGLIIAALLFQTQFHSSGVTGVTDLYQTAAVSAFALLNITLLIGPISHFTDKFLFAYKYRRHFGVATFLLALTHASFVLKVFFKYDILLELKVVFTFFGATALYIMSLLAVTSWDSVQKKISNKAWNLIHTGAWLGYVIFAFVFFKVADGALLQTDILLVVLIIVGWLLLSPWSVAAYLSKLWLSKVNGWKQLHLLVYLAYFSVVIHIWTGSVAFAPGWVQILFWGMVVVTVGLHLYGLGLKFKAFIKDRAMPNLKAIEINGKEYFPIGSINDFEEGKGKRILVNDTALAVFKHEGKLIAYSSRCPHQGGPLEKGSIVNGYLECPWHHWQYSVKDGCGPPGYTDCVAYYEVLLQAEVALVCLANNLAQSSKTDS